MLAPPLTESENDLEVGPKYGPPMTELAGEQEAYRGDYV
jgi:hypothetical protein